MSAYTAYWKFTQLGDSLKIHKNKINTKVTSQKTNRIQERKRNHSILHGSTFPLSSVAQLCPTLCDPMDCSMPGLPDHHQLPEFTQTYVHWLVMPSNHLILCRPFLLLPSIFSSIRVFSNELFPWGGQSIQVSASTSVLPMNTQDWSLQCPSWISLQSKGLSRVFSNITVQKHQFFGAHLSL